MPEYEPHWLNTAGSRDIDLFGFRYDVGLDPVAVNVDRMIDAFVRACRDLDEIWAIALSRDSHRRVRSLSHAQGSAETFRLEDELWANVIYEFACAHRRNPLERDHLLRSLAPLYMARVASFVLEAQSLNADQVEDRIEHLCRCFEQQKPYLKALWAGAQVASPVIERPAQSRIDVKVEV
jgi:hypothetical protein